MGTVVTLEADILVVGGGTAGCVAAVKAKEALPDGGAGSACEYIAGTDSPQIDDEAVEDEKKRVFRPLDHPAGIQPHLLEYKLRRHVNDYLQPPKSANRLERGLAYFERARAEIEQLGATGERRVRAQDAGRA
jgi:succinate dehydrogenase/fumarate reductase flavoprotein subunit